MKKVFLPIACVAIVNLVACENKDHNEMGSVKELDSYVDSVKRLDAGATAENWNAIENRYAYKLKNAEVAAEGKEERKEVDENKEEFEAIRTKFEPKNPSASEVGKTEEIKTEEAPVHKKQALRDALFGQGKIGSDMSFSWVNAKNIRSVYENFVASVKENKKDYSREDWDEVKVLYEALDTRKNEVEKELESKDNLAIAKRKVEFASYKAVERPLSKVEENQDAKDKDK